jgi:hypothetical protein
LAVFSTSTNKWHWNGIGIGCLRACAAITFSAPAAVFSLQQCNTSASPYLGEIGVNGTIHTQFFIIKGDVCVNIFSSAWP